MDFSDLLEGGDGLRDHWPENRKGTAVTLGEDTCRHILNQVTKPTSHSLSCVHITGTHRMWWEEHNDLCVLHPQIHKTLLGPVSILLLLLLSRWVLSDSFVTPWTVAHHAPLFSRFPRQECWSRLPFPSPGDLPDPETKHTSPALQAYSSSLSHQFLSSQLLNFASPASREMFSLGLPPR